jgi:hypothetical protein
VKRFLHIVLVLVAAAACQNPRIIPKDTLTDIYEDMFLADQLVRERNLPQPQMDTLLVYEAVFNKYGYNTDDYLNSVRYYLKDPERFAKVFDEVNRRLEAKVKDLDRLIEFRQRLDERRAETYPLLDSILTPFSKEAVFVGLARVERDSSAYPAWFRLTAVQEDTLMMPVDSVEARKERKARRDTLKNDHLPEKLTAEPLKPASRPLGLRERPVEKELIKEEVEE